jgi:hypothetical protein
MAVVEAQKDLQAHGGRALARPPASAARACTAPGQAKGYG